jgi:hypothetical protein
MKINFECRKHAVGLTVRWEVEDKIINPKITIHVDPCPLCLIEANPQEKILKFENEKVRS